MRGARPSGSRRAACRSPPTRSRSPFRIYRDVRFGKDKSPYKTAASARFMAPGGGPGAYFHLEPGEIYAGGGL